VARRKYDTNFDLDDDREQLLSGVRARRWLRLSGGDLPYPVSISIGVGVDGRLACTGLIVGAAEGDSVEITSTSLRSVKIADLLQDVSALTDDEDFGDLMHHVIQSVADDLPGPRTRPGARGLPHEHFETVAREYRRALRVAQRAPVQELRRRMGAASGHDVPEPTARRWIQRARDKGLLGEATPGKAGERLREEER